MIEILLAVASFIFLFAAAGIIVYTFYAEWRDDKRDNDPSRR